MSNAATVGALRVILGLDAGEFEGGLTKAQAHLKKVGAQMQSMGQTMMVAGATMTATITAPIIAAGFHLLQGSQDAAAAAAQVKAALESMGGASGKTFDQLSKTAEQLRNLTGVDDDEILTKVTANLLTFGNVAGAVFDRAQRAVLDISARMKTDLMGSTMMVGKALNDPVKGLAALRRVGIQFTEQQEKQIKAMAEANNMAGAQSIMLRELERQFGGAAEAAGKADVWMPLKTALMDLEGAFEPLIRDLFAPLINKVAEMARAFAGVSPQMQTFVLAAAGIAAIAGPVITGLGAMVTAAGALTAALGAGGVLAGVGTVLAGIVPFILPIAVAVAAVAAAFFLFRDDVEPVLKRLWQTAQETLGPALGDLFSAVGEMASSIAATFKQAIESDAGQAVIQFGLAVSEIMGGTVIQVLTALVKTVTVVVTAIADGFKVLGLLLSGDFVGALGAMMAGTQRAIDGVKGIFGGLATYAVQTMQRLVTGVTGWLTGKLFAVLEGVIRKVRTVSDTFFKLYDAVVGHSYIPDMVTEVGEWMNRLDEKMVKPAVKAANATAQAFEQVRDRANAAMENVLTDQERAWREHQQQVRALQAGIAQGGPDAEVWRQGLARENAGWDARDLKMPDTLPDLSPVENDAGIQRLNTVWSAMQQKIRDSREDFADSFAYGMEDAMRGDWKSLLQNFAADALNNAFKSAGRTLFDFFQKGMGNGSGGWDFSRIGSAAMNVLGKLPGFANEGTLRPSGASGIDSQLVSFWKSPREQVDIYNPNGGGSGSRGGGGGGNYFDLRGALTTQDIIDQMNQIGRTSEDRAYSRAVKDVPALAQSQTAKQQQHTVGRRRR